MKELPETNSKVLESSQDLAKSAAVFGEADLEWSNAAARRVSAIKGS